MKISIHRLAETAQLRPLVMPVQRFAGEYVRVIDGQVHPDLEHLLEIGKITWNGHVGRRHIPTLPLIHLHSLFRFVGLLEKLLREAEGIVHYCLGF